MAVLTSSLSRGRIAVGLVILITLYVVSYQYHVTPKAKQITHSLASSIFHGRPSKYEFAEIALAHQVSDPFNISAISDLCLKRPPNEDVIFRCQPGIRGVGHIRNEVLHCTRFAMEAGASMILPNFHRRSTSNLSDLDGQIGDFEHFFDRQHYIDTIETACPHIHIYDKPRPEWTDSDMEIPTWPDPIAVSTLSEHSPWRTQFDGWFKASTTKMRTPVIVRSVDLGHDKPVMDDGMELYWNMGRMLQFRPDTRRLAALCLAELNDRFKPHMDPSHALFENAFVGADLRTSSGEADAGRDPGFEDQSDWYINHTVKHNLNIIFAAGRNDVVLERFQEKALSYSITVVQSSNLLSGNDLRELNNLLWDQRALVDFEILLKASQFGGYARSSFSQHIALRRHYLSNIDDPFSDPDNHFSDELSVVYGRFDPGWEAEGIITIWP